MTTAYQSDAVQINPLAFQVDIGAIEGFAFQQCAFQYDAFQADICDEIVVPPITPPPPQTFGGYYGNININRSDTRPREKSYLAQALAEDDEMIHLITHIVTKGLLQ